MAPRTFTLIECAGSPYQMGYQHGAQYRDLVRTSMRTYQRILARFPRPATLQEATALSVESLPEAEAYAQELVEEVRGIAAGAGLSFEDVFSLNASLDICSALRRRPVPAVPHTCSTYGVTAAGSA